MRIKNGNMPVFTNDDLHRIEHQKYYAIEFYGLVEEINDFLDYQECHISGRYNAKLNEIRELSEQQDFPDGRREHLEKNAAHQFQVILPLRARYTAIIMLVTSVEWSVKILTQRLRGKLKKRTGQVNETVHNLRNISELSGVPQSSIIDKYEAIVRVRDCIIHNAGLLANHKFEEELPQAIAKLEGFELGNWHYTGTHVIIERNAVSFYVRKITEFIVALHRAIHEQSLADDNDSDF